MNDFLWFCVMGAVGAFLGWALAFLQHRLGIGPFAKKVKEDSR